MPAKLPIRQVPEGLPRTKSTGQGCQVQDPDLAARLGRLGTDPDRQIAACFSRLDIPNGISAAPTAQRAPGRNPEDRGPVLLRTYYVYSPQPHSTAWRQLFQNIRSVVPFAPRPPIVKGPACPPGRRSTHRRGCAAEPSLIKLLRRLAVHTPSSRCPQLVAGQHGSLFQGLVVLRVAVASVHCLLPMDPLFVTAQRALAPYCMSTSPAIIMTSESTPCEAQACF